MSKIIRFSKEYYDWSGVERPWTYENYRPFNYDLISKSTGKVDSAFGDRLHFWSQAIVIGQLTKFKWQLQFNQNNYPETYFFNFPKSIFLSEPEFYRGINHFEYLSQDDYTRMVRYGIVPKYMPDHLIINTSPNGIIKGFFTNPYHLIQLKYPEMEGELRSLFGRYIGVHLRRFYGIMWDDSDLTELTPELREDYKKEARYNDHSYTWKYIKDEEYFKQLDQYTNCKFYISTDLPAKYYYSKWSERYPNRIFTMKNVMKKFNDILIKYYGKESVENNQKLIYRMMDYFALMYSKEITCPQHHMASTISSWASTAGKLGRTNINVFKAGYV